MRAVALDRFVTIGRRRLLGHFGAGLAVAVGGPLFSGRLWADPVFGEDPFSLGVASGEPAPDGVVLWTRIAPQPFHGGGMPMQAVPVRWQVAADERMASVVRSGEAIAHSEVGHSVHVEVGGLEPARDYWYRFQVGGEASPIGRTRTAPAPGAQLARLRFGVAGCQRYEDGLYTAYRHLADEQLDFVFHYGDYIYEHRSEGYAPEPGHLVRALPEPSDEIYTLVDYRNRYAAYKADPDLQAAHASAPFLASFDDHEVDNDWAAEIDQDGTPPELFLLRRAAAFQAFYEHMPLRRSALPRGPDILAYRRIAYGRLAQVNLLDTRQHRSDQPCGGGGQSRASCPAALEADRTMLGAAQEGWLQDGLAGSSAVWNVLAQQVVFMQRDRSGDPEATSYHMDKWDGAVAARDRLLRFVQDHGIANLVVLSGDAHNHWAGELKADFDDPRSASLGSELVATSISSGGDGEDQRPGIAAVLAKNPHIAFYNNQRGYLSCEVTPELWRTHFRVVDYVSRPGAPLKTRKTLVVEAGRPGLREA